MNKFSIVLSVLALVLVGGLILLGNTQGVPGENGLRGLQGLKGDKGDKGLTGPIGLQGPRGFNGLNGTNALGALTSPVIHSPFLRVNGLQTDFRRVQLGWAWDGTSGAARTEGTTTPCRIQAPAGATTTGRFTIHIESQATSTFIELGRATAAKNDGNIFATTTLIGSQYNLPANTGVDLVASTTASQSHTAAIFGPEEWFVVKTAGGTNGTLRLTGTCTGIFEQL